MLFFVRSSIFFSLAEGERSGEASFFMLRLLSQSSIPPWKFVHLYDFAIDQVDIIRKRTSTSKMVLSDSYYMDQIRQSARTALNKALSVLLRRNFPAGNRRFWLSRLKKSPRDRGISPPTQNIYFLTTDFAVSCFSEQPRIFIIKNGRGAQEKT